MPRFGSGCKENIEELYAIVEESANAPLSEEQRVRLRVSLETLEFLMEELRQNKVSLGRLKKILFGATTEKTDRVLKEEKPGAKSTEKNKSGEKKSEKEKSPGHGRLSAAAYTGAEQVNVPHEELTHGGVCPEEGCHGKLYRQNTPARLVRIQAVAPISGSVYNCERLRCNDCGKVFTAAAPEGVGEKKYDESVAAMVAVLKYGCGVPLNRIEKLQKNFGVPLPASTQWEHLEEGAEAVEIVFEELIREAAGADVLHNDDTVAKILEINKNRLADPLEEEGQRKRAGCVQDAVGELSGAWSPSVGGGARELSGGVPRGAGDTARRVSE